MQILALVKCLAVLHLLTAVPTLFGVGRGTILSAATLPFNPIKLACLIGWVYLCLYFVQRIQFSPLVPKNYKSIANIVTLFVGPLLLFVLMLVNMARSSSEEQPNVLATIKERFQNLLTRIMSSGLIGSADKPKIELVDSSGRSFKEIYGQGDNKRHDSHILNLTERIIADALDGRASDILIDPKGQSSYTIRFRIDGALRVVEQLDANTCQAVINSIKAVSGMDISEKRRPQDGSFAAKLLDGSVSFRVASAGVLEGEKLSIRALNKNAGKITLADVGLSEKQRKVIENELARPSGMILICGPTGSGKTTTLYGMLNSIDFFTRNVITVEDPIECSLPNTSQIEVNPKAGITFASSLRSILRQDPDVICVGEIRDEETAAIALRAAQTGHLVLATIHCESNAAAMIRLMDLGVSSLLLSSGLSAIISQRLIRLLCENCKRPAHLTQAQVLEFRKRNVNYRNILEAVGCDKCGGTGYYGRTAIFDILVLDKDLKALIADGKLSAAQLRKEGDQKGKSNIQKQGLMKVVSGTTSIEELNRVVG